MAVMSWIALGAVTGLLANAVLRGRFPGGRLGSILSGAAGGFLGGATFALLAGRAVDRPDAASLAVAIAGAALLLTAIRKAGHGDPLQP